MDTPLTNERLAEVERLRDVIERALEAGHCYPADGSDRGQCLIDHVALGHRDRLALRAELAAAVKLIIQEVGTGTPEQVMAEIESEVRDSQA